jgi:Gram-negative porin
MIGGLLKTTSAVAMLAAAGFAMSAVTAVKANAADYGGDCCADLEERVAELEATTVRHANRKISLTISGSVTEAMLFWDDGIESDFNVVLPDPAGAGFTFSGEGKVTSDVSVAFVMAINVRRGNPADGAETFIADDGQASALQSYKEGQNISVDNQYVSLKSKSAGSVSLGYRNLSYKSFNDGAFDLGGSSTITNFMSGSSGTAAGLSIRSSDGDFVTSGAVPNGVNWYDVISNVGGNKGMSIRYDSPSFAGFTISAAWGEDDTASAGLAYSGKFSETDFTAGIAYQTSNTPNEGPLDDERVTVGASVYNAPSGLYLTGEYNVAYGDATDADADAFNAGLQGLGRTPESYFVKLGWRKNVNGLGETNVWGSYINSKDITIAGVEAQAFTVGVAQDLDAVGATMFLQYDNREIVSGTVGENYGVVGDFRCGDAAGLQECEGATTLMGGMKVTF